MRRLPVLLTLAALAGCGAPAGETEENAAEAVAPAGPANSATPPPADAAADQAAAIPAAFHGVWDRSREACGRPSDGRLAVDAEAMRFHESIGTVRSVAVEDAEAISVVADFEGEGARWQAVRTLRLADGGATLIVEGDGTRMRRVRCPEGAS